MKLDGGTTKCAPYKIQAQAARYIAVCEFGHTVWSSTPSHEIVDFAWSAQGQFLAMIDEHSSCIQIWDAASCMSDEKSVGIKDQLSVVSWSETGAKLVVGSVKGNFVIYDQGEAIITPLLGRHIRKITCAAWKGAELIALTGEDKTITINSAEGDLLKRQNLKYLPSMLKFDPFCESDQEDCKLACVLGTSSLWIVLINEMDYPFELTFQSKYGEIAAYHWMESGKIALGFSAGHFIVMSTEKSEMGKEIYHVRDFKDALYDITVSLKLNRCAAVGDQCVKIHDLSNALDMLAISEIDGAHQADSATSVTSSLCKRCRIEWSEDGQVLAVSTTRNSFHLFLTQLPSLAVCSPAGNINLSARMTSLLEVTLEPMPFTEVHTEASSPLTTQVKKLDSEPTVIGLGGKYLATAHGSLITLYDLAHLDAESNVTWDHTYEDTVKQIHLNDTFLAVCEQNGRLSVLPIIAKENSNEQLQSTDGDTKESIALKSSTWQSEILSGRFVVDTKVTDFQLVKQYLIYATESGKLCHFHLNERTVVNRHVHSKPIVRLSAHPVGALLIFVDAAGKGTFYNVLTEHCFELPDWPTDIKHIIWDRENDENPLFVAFNETRLFVYRYFRYGRIVGRNPVARDGSISIQSGLPIKMPDKPKCLEVLTGECRAIGVIRIPHGHLPLAVSGGEVCFLSPSGRLSVQNLSTHNFRMYTKSLLRSNKKLGASNFINEGGNLVLTCQRESNKNVDLSKLSRAELEGYFDQAMRAGCPEDAQLFAETLNEASFWTTLGMTSLRLLQFDLAIYSFRKSNNTGSILIIDRIRSIEDQFLLAGYIAMILKKFDEAQELFLMSTKPTAALEMRRDLLQWEAALQLAKSLAPNEIPAISREYAVEMEYIGDYVNALMHFERALTECDPGSRELKATNYDVFQEIDWRGDVPDDTELLGFRDVISWKEHVNICKAGIARNAIRLGDFRRGIQLAKESGSTSLLRTCADILEQMKQLPEAADLYKLSGSYESAVGVYLRCKNYHQAGELLRRVTNAPRLHLQYAKARESEGAYKDAVVAYEAAQDWDSVVRLQLDKLGNIDEAIRIVHQKNSVEGAKLVAYYFIRINDHPSAIRFLVLSKCLDEAFQLASKHRKMDVYADAIGSDASLSEYQSIACYFENERNWFMAGKFHFKAKQYEKAVRLLLRTPYSEKSPALDLALEAVGLAKDSRLTHLLLVYLMGEADGVPKDARHLFRLYMVLKQYKEAARTAVIIAREEQTNGNYRRAHDMLFNLVQELRQRDLRVPAEMADNLALLHSYILAKIHVKLGHHLRAARMLLRVAENISKFPAHVVPILTSTVIECQKAGLKSASFGYAAMLLRPEYRETLDPKHKRKLETLVRRPDRKSEDPGEKGEDDKMTPCPLCSAPLLSSNLYCTECRNTLPYCIITGAHVVKNDFAVCPNCKFPAIYSEFMSYLDEFESPSCPMCSAVLSRDAIRQVADPTKFLATWIDTKEEEDDDMETIKPITDVP